MATMHSGDKTMALGDFLWNYTPITPWINLFAERRGSGDSSTLTI